VQDGPNADGEMYTRKAVPSDYFPSPFPNAKRPLPPTTARHRLTFSLIAKAREVERGFPQFVFDIFTQYQEGGPDYIYSLLTGYEEPPAGFQVPEGGHITTRISMRRGPCHAEAALRRSGDL
jgi:ubiquinol-cytochrome c reductase cytochrome c1 subunit